VQLFLLIDSWIIKGRLLSFIIYVISNGRTIVNDELERIWNVWLVVNFNVFCLPSEANEKQENLQRRIAVKWAEYRNRRIQNPRHSNLRLLFLNTDVAVYTDAIPAELQESSVLASFGGVTNRAVTTAVCPLH
jgi:hypothetical protein